MRHTLDESPNTGDLELIGMLPAELRDLCRAFKALDFALGSRRVTRNSSGHGGMSDPTLNDVADKRREELRKFRERTRKTIGRLTEDIERWVGQIKRCKTCGAKNSWDDAWCGESFPPPEKGCGEWFVKPEEESRSRTRSADA